MGDAQDLVGLLAGDEPALNSQAFLGNLLAALIAEFLHCALVTLFLEVEKYFLYPLCLSQWSNHMFFLRCFRRTVRDHLLAEITSGVHFSSMLMCH